MEESLMRTLMLARGDMGYLLSRPIALGLLVIGAASLIAPVAWRRFWQRKAAKEQRAAR
jgi:TctA family transporter